MYHSRSQPIFIILIIIVLIPTVIINCGKSGPTITYEPQEGLISTTLVSGKFRGIDVVGNYCYCIANGALKILSIDNPLNPALVGEIPTPGNAHIIKVHGNYAYILNGFGLIICDIYDPENPLLTTEFTESFNPHRMVMNDHYVIVSHAIDGFRVIDISDPHNPVIVGSIDSIGHSLSPYYIEDEILYTSGDNSVAIYSIANPNNPTLVGNFGSSIPGTIAGYNSHLYVNMGLEGIDIYSIFSPVSPVYVGHIPGNYSMITFYDNYVYFKRRYTSSYTQIEIFDISNPAEPSLAGTYLTSYEPKYQMIAKEGYLFTIDDTSSLENTLYISDLSTPADPVEISTFVSIGGFISDVFVFDNYAYVIGPQIIIVDVSDVDNPVVLGNTERRFNNGRIVKSGDNIYIAGEYISGMPIYDVSNPESPTYIGSFEVPSLSNFRDLCIVDNYIYVAGGDQGLLVLDIANPAAPELIEQVENSNPESITSSIFVSGSYAYFTVCGSGLQIYNVSDPYNLTMVNDGTISGCSKSIFVVDNIAILSIDYERIMYFDVSDPENPTPIEGGYGGPMYWSIPRITFAGNTMFVPLHDIGGVDIVNISDPRNVYFERNLETPYSASGVSAVNGIIYVADGSSLLLYRFPY